MLASRGCVGPSATYVQPVFGPYARLKIGAASDLIEVEVVHDVVVKILVVAGACVIVTVVRPSLYNVVVGAVPA